MQLLKEAGAELHLATLTGGDLGTEDRTRNEIRESVSKLQVWIDQASWMPVQLVIEHVSSGETLTMNFMGLARNLKLNPELFKDKWPKGTQKLER